MMNNRTTQHVRKQQGFSLIEVLVVMTILAVIFGLVVSNVTGGQDKAKYKQAKIEVQKLSQSVSEFYLDTGNMPDSLDELYNDNGESMWMGPYVKEKELKDPWGEEYKYSIPGENNEDFSIVSYGNDKSPGGKSLDQDIKSWDI